MSAIKKVLWDTLPRLIVVALACVLLLDLRRSYKRTDAALAVAEQWQDIAMRFKAILDRTLSAMEGTSPRYVNAPMPPGYRATNAYLGAMPGPGVSLTTNDGKIYITSTNL